MASSFRIRPALAGVAEPAHRAAIEELARQVNAALDTLETVGITPSSHVHSGADITTGTVAAARIDSAIARLASPTFTGDPKAPTASAGDNDTSIATTAFVTTATKLVLLGDSGVVGAGGVDSIDFVGLLTSTYPVGLLFWELAPETDGASPVLRMGTGGAFDSGAADYRFARIEGTEAAAVSGGGSSGTTGINISGGTGNAANEHNSGVAVLFQPSGTTYHKRVVSLSGFADTAGAGIVRITSGRRVTTSARPDVQLLMSSGQIAAGGRALLYGLKV